MIASKRQREITYDFAKRALLAFCFLFAAAAVPMISKALGLRGPAWESARTATVLLVGLAWYSFWRPRHPGSIGVGFLIVLWTAVAAIWVAVIVNSSENRQVIGESVSIASTILAAECTLRHVTRTNSERMRDRP